MGKVMVKGGAKRRIYYCNSRPLNFLRHCTSTLYGTDYKGG